MAKNSITIFYEKGGLIRAETKIGDIMLPVDSNNYTFPESGYYLDDPYEGELFAFMMYLFAPWTDANEREMMWPVKSKKL